MEFLKQFPWTLECRELENALKRYGKQIGPQGAVLKQRSSLRLICKGRRSTDRAAEFVMDSPVIESFLGEILRDGQNVVVFGRNGQRQDFQLSKDNTSDDRYVFRGNLMGAIINENENIDGHGIELWGYPPKGPRVFVLTVGVVPG